MKYKPIFCLCLLLCLPFLSIGQTRHDTLPSQSRLLRFAETGMTDSARAVLNVLLREQDTGEPVMGATMLLQRQNPDQVHGKISQWDGFCRFKVAPGTYNFRVQLTGMVAFEKEGIELPAGREYDMEIELARMKPPVPSAKQQAGKN